jgi:trans-aconitate 2-methyltransferase
MPAWDASLYLQFRDERTQPSIDLASRITLPSPRRIIDLGCGPGNSTEILRRRWPEADIVGLDNSPEMITAATKAYPGGRWVLGDIATWEAASPLDLVFSNAALQWVKNHARVFPQLLRQVAEGGALAVQIPAHIASPVHQLMLQIADEERWWDKMEKAKSALTMERPSFYYDALKPYASRIELWETEYNHVMENSKAIVEWIRGTGLRPFLEAVASEDDQNLFLEKLRSGVAQAYKPQYDGRVLFPFRRLFVIAYR